MAEIRVDLNLYQVAKLNHLFREYPRRIPRVVAAAVNETTKKGKVQVAKDIREKVNMKAADVKRYILVRRATPATKGGALVIDEGERVPLKQFGARQSKKGVTYKIDKQGGRKLAKGAFGPKIPRLGKHVFKRYGKESLPIRKLLGPSAWAVFKRAKLEKKTRKDTRVEFRKQLNRRIRFELMKLNK